MARQLKIIETNKPDPAYVTHVLAKAFINTYGPDKVMLAINEIKKRNLEKEKQ